MNTALADSTTGELILSTPCTTGDISDQLRSGGWRINTFGFFLRSILFLCLAGMTTGTFAKADGFASRNGGTTGGEGGKVVRASTGKQIHEAMCGRRSENEPIIIEVEGTINHGNTDKVNGSCNTTDDRIEIKEVSNITIIGVGNGAVFDQLGIHIRSSKNIILRNLTIQKVKKSGSPTSNGGDAIGMESDVSNVWIDHCTLEADGGESDGYDALCDMKARTKYVTVSYCILRNSGRGGLIGSSDSDTDNGPVTFHHNVYENIDSRTPLLRAATVHSYNNHFNGIQKSGMNPRIGGKIKAENNYFENAKNPLGTFYTDKMGSWDVSGNIWGENVTWQSGDEATPAGPDPVSTTSINIPYTYSLDEAACVPEILEKTAGANKNLSVSDGKCTPTAIRKGVMNPGMKNLSNVSNSTPHCNLLGRTLRNTKACRLNVTNRGLVIDE